MFIFICRRVGRHGAVLPVRTPGVPRPGKKDRKGHRQYEAG
jgi:hypothetical protein